MKILFKLKKIKFLSKPIFLYVYFLIFHPEMLAKKKKYGNMYPEKKFMIIRGGYNSGLMALFFLIARQAYSCNKSKIIPIVDFRNFKNTQFHNTCINSWEIFFTQPKNCENRNYTLDEVYKSKNVYLSGFSLFPQKSKLSEDINLSVDFSKKLSDCIFSTVSIQPNILELAKLEENNIPMLKNCIGVLARGTDYVDLKPVGEPIQPTVEQVINQIKIYKELYNDSPIFLVTEDQRIKYSLMQVFSDVYVVSKDVTYNSDDWDGKNYLSNRKTSFERKIYENKIYLIKLILLSRCRFLIAGKTSGSNFARLYNFQQEHQYESTYIFNLGDYS